MLRTNRLGPPSVCLKKNRVLHSPLTKVTLTQFLNYRVFNVLFDRNSGGQWSTKTWYTNPLLFFSIMLRIFSFSDLGGLVQRILEYYARPRASCVAVRRQSGWGLLKSYHGWKHAGGAHRCRQAGCKRERTEKGASVASNVRKKRGRYPYAPLDYTHVKNYFPLQYFSCFSVSCFLLPTFTKGKEAMQFFF